MRVDLFDFDLPPALIAQAPVRPRDAARLLVVDRGPWRETAVRELPGLLRPGDLLVLNRQRGVLPTRFFGRRGEVAVEVTLVERIDAASWWALARPGKRLRLGDRVELHPGLVAEVAGKDDEGRVRLGFELAGDGLLAAIRDQGAMPLPPYIHRERGGDPQDRHDYQTVFARPRCRGGADGLAASDRRAAGPAGCRRRRALLRHPARRCRHLRPVKADDTEAHRMHASNFARSTPYFELGGRRPHPAHRSVSIAV